MYICLFQYDDYKLLFKFKRKINKHFEIFFNFIGSKMLNGS